MTNETYEKLQAELSRLLNTEKYKRMTSKDKDVYKQAVLACKSVVSHYRTNAEAELTCDECCGCDILPQEDCAYYEASMREESDIDENWYSDEYRTIGEDEGDEVEE